MESRHELEIAVSQEAGLADASGGVGQRAKEALDELGNLLSEAIAPLRERLERAAATADEVEIRLSLALKANGNWVVISAGAAATVQVKLAWKKKTV
jgi:hypothetical protein